MNSSQKLKAKCFLQKLIESLISRDNNSDDKHFSDIKQNEKTQAKQNQDRKNLKDNYLLNQTFLLQ